MKLFEEAIASLKKPGSVGIIPTDTVYGLVARVTDREAVERINSLKQRESKPGTVIAASIEQLESIGLKHRYLKAVEQFWPGPVSVVIPLIDPDLNYLTQGKLSLAVRLPSDDQLVSLLKETGPLVTSSANMAGQPTAVNLEQARGYFGDKLDFYIDGGDLSSKQPSTVIRIVDDAIEVLRPGAVKL